MMFKKKYDKAAYFAQQACVMGDGRNVEALFLKASALFQLKKYQEAAVHCTEALKYCPYR